VAGGGVLYSGAEQVLLDFARTHNVPLVETQAGKGAVDWEEPLHFGSPGVTGTGCGNELAAKADVVHRRRHPASRISPPDPGRVLEPWPQAHCRSTSTASTLTSVPPNRLSPDAKVALQKISAALGGHRFSDPDFAARESLVPDDRRSLCPRPGATNCRPTRR
jgi:3D-(3,5/4)-trihydroxycyclohexane-1,2-dione acylhydrolase (decyclizing)